MFSKTKAIILSIFLSASSLLGMDFKIDSSHSNVGFEITHLMISSVEGEFKEYTGDITLDPKTKEIQKLKGVIQAKSIDTGIEKRDNHLRSADFFEVKTYPEITFEMTSFKHVGDEGVVTGNLTIHGVTKEVQLESEVTGVIVHNGTTKVGLELEGEINRKDFGLNWNKVIEAGGVAVGEEVRMEIELELHEKVNLDML